MAKNNDTGGCGCLVVILIFAGAFIVDKCRGVGEDNSQQLATEVASDNAYSNDYSENELDEQDRLYINNHLKTGETPYIEFYGDNYVCKKDQCSAIEVTAPENSDIVVIIKRNNEDGAVISHAYIRAGCKYSFDLPNGTFQPFFYYGEGWNPQKEMGNGVKGGFVKYESFSKDAPQAISDCVLSYVLQLKRDGNFQTEGSSRSEVF